MNLVLNCSTVAESGIYEEAGAIVLGFKFSDGAPIHSLIVQIEEETSHLARDRMGMYVEIDGKGFYGGVVDFKYDEVDARIRLRINSGKHKGISGLEIEMPPALAAGERELLQKLASAYNISLPRSN